MMLFANLGDTDISYLINQTSWLSIVPVNIVSFVLSVKLTDIGKPAEKEVILT